jgi:hypothetical protein
MVVGNDSSISKFSISVSRNNIIPMHIMATVDHSTCAVRTREPPLRASQSAHPQKVLSSNSKVSGAGP